ncbi:MAG: hypothetical protein M0R38_02470 [Bacteroidia bacterium]|nr:hypothetical protein [Bacteroidia bacterium]
MSDQSELKKRLRYFRLIVYALLLAYIWIQYEYRSGNWDYDNGQIKVSGKNVNGKDEGTWVWYYANGKKQMQGDFLKGKRVGRWIIWDSIGNKISEVQYVNDKLNGEFVRWYSNGNIASKGLYKDDKVVWVEYLHPDGTQQ